MYSVQNDPTTVTVKINLSSKLTFTRATSFYSRLLFAHKESEVLASALIHVRLPGLNNLDQMYLMALSNTVAHTHTDFSDKFSSEKSPSSGKCSLRSPF